MPKGVHARLFLLAARHTESGVYMQDAELERVRTVLSAPRAPILRPETVPLAAMNPSGDSVTKMLNWIEEHGKQHSVGEEASSSVPQHVQHAVKRHADADVYGRHSEGFVLMDVKERTPLVKIKGSDYFAAKTQKIRAVQNQKAKHKTRRSASRKRQQAAKAAAASAAAQEAE
jgi:hypothetical protein